MKKVRFRALQSTKRDGGRRQIVWSLEWAKEKAKKGNTPKCHPADKVKERSDGKEAEVLKNHSPVTSLKVRVCA
nr:hypothetical protein [Tanacetum cinerariifolium]